jgi:hypothetical protein
MLIHIHIDPIIGIIHTITAFVAPGAAFAVGAA